MKRINSQNIVNEPHRKTNVKFYHTVQFRKFEQFGFGPNTNPKIRIPIIRII